MDTLTATSVTNFQVPKTFHPTTTNHHHHRTISPIRHHNHHLSAAAKPAGKPPFAQKDNFTPLYSTYSKRVPPISLKPPRSSAHVRAASGYAAALVDVAQSNGVVLEVERDVRRLLRVLRNGQVWDFMMDEMVEEREKGEVVKELVEKGKFEGHLVGLVKMVIEKGRRVEIVKEILEEFQRIIYQLTPAAAAAAAAPVAPAH